MSRVVLVTGASSGIGAACARELARRGWSPVLFARSEAVLERADELKATGVRGDLTDVADLERLVRTALAVHGRIDGVVVSTGDPEPGDDLLSIADDQWHAWLDLLFLDVVRLARIVTPHLIAAGGGSWVNIGSADLREPDSMAPFSATIRGCLGGFTKLYAREHAAHGVRMNLLSPSYAWDAEEGPAGAWSAVSLGAIGRAARYDEVARCAAFLLSDDAAFVSGIDLKVDAASFSRAL